MAPTQHHKEGLIESFGTMAAKILPEPFYGTFFQQDRNLNSLKDPTNICDLKPRTFSMKEVAEHSHYESCWLVFRDKVYDVTEFMHQHPGGVDIIMENAGRDITVTFDDKGHSAMAYKMLSKYYIGELIEADKIDK